MCRAPGTGIAASPSSSTSGPPGSRIRTARISSEKQQREQSGQNHGDEHDDVQNRHAAATAEN
jgi:hypothetical protein